ncbi:MAG: pentapeptide repeat-containing protein [Anaerolineae bacterium]|nr:pentapeptide repeat-containing protein [Anaerolineae bacterium]
MQDARGNGRLAQIEILTETTTYPIETNGESDLPEAEDSPENGKEAELVRSYNEGKRNFSMANLHGANLQGARLQNARLFMADLRKANLQGANLQGTKLRGANLGEADLRGADLRGADLLEVNLAGAKLAGARLDDMTQISTTWRLICETINDSNNGHRSNVKTST